MREGFAVVDEYAVIAQRAQHAVEASRIRAGGPRQRPCALRFIAKEVGDAEFGDHMQTARCPVRDGQVLDDFRWRGRFVHG